jgi:hypothetical protein
MSTGAATFRFLAKVLLLVAPLVVAVVFGPRLLRWARPQLSGLAIRIRGVGGGADGVSRAELPPPGGPIAAPEASSSSVPPAPPPEARGAATAAQRLARLQQESLGKSTVLAPQEAKVDAAGERIRWFQGFGLSVESEPKRAAVRVDGRDVGETPLVTTVDCAPGDEVVIEVHKKGRKPQRRTTTCREDTLVELRVKLR